MSIIGQKFLNVWNPAGLVNIQPQLVWNDMAYYLVYSGIFLVGLIILVLLRKRIQPNLRDQLGSVCWTNLGLSLVLFFFREQSIPLLGMDLWRFLQECATVIWIFFIVRFYLKTYRQEAVSELVKARREKYLPGHK